VRLVDSPYNCPRQIPHRHHSSPHPACMRSSCKPRWIPHFAVADSAAKNWLAKEGGPGASGPEDAGSVRLGRPRRSTTCHGLARNGRAAFYDTGCSPRCWDDGVEHPPFYPVRCRVRLFATMPRSSVMSLSSISKPALLSARRITSRTVVRSKTALIRTACCT
jgi:hypothetical protein